MANVPAYFGHVAQCLYVLTDENPPAIEEVRSNAPYSSCILSIVQSQEGLPQANGKNKEIEDNRSVALQVLCCGRSSMDFVDSGSN